MALTRTVHSRLTPALLLAGAALLAYGPPSAGAATTATAASTSSTTSGTTGTTGTTGTPGMGIPAARADHLTVAYDDGSGGAQTYNLACGHDEFAQGPGGGEGEQDAHGPFNRRAEDERDGADACAHLDRIGGPLPAVPPDQICTMMYGGPQTAQVTGVWHGRRVTEDYRRTNGCEVARWTGMIPVLPAPEQGGPEAGDLWG